MPSSHKVDIKHTLKDMPPAAFHGTEPEVDRFPSSASKEQMLINSAHAQRPIILVSLYHRVSWRYLSP
jgi:hypothetical protein